MDFPGLFPGHRGFSLAGRAAQAFIREGPTQPGNNWSA